MDAKQLMSWAEEAATHQKIVGDYEGCYSLGVTDTPPAFLLRVEPSEVMNRSVNQTLSRTVIVSFVAFLSMLALYLFGGASLRGLAEAQIIGVLIGTLSSIFVACPLLLLMHVTKQDLMPKAKDEAALARRP